MTDEERSRVDRRTFLAGGVAAGGALAGAGALGALAAAARTSKKRSPGPPRAGVPNLLVIMVDQMREPLGFPAGPALGALMPNLARLQNGAVSFGSHYTAANDCTPSRGTLVTGLYSHQTGCLVTGGSTLAPQFPTWGTLLREHGYETAWFGKWHLTSHDNRWTVGRNGHALEKYGFSGGTYPSPDGGPGQGWRTDPLIASQFRSWFARAPSSKPWCATVSLVNPHDIAWWYRWSNQVATERSAPARIRSLPANYETPSRLIAQHKPRLQLSLQQTAATGFGTVPFSGPSALRSWLPFMNLYLKLLGEVDRHIGSVLAALASRPHIAANTVVVFTSDHGEYAASHGLRGKGAGVYDEALRVPLSVRDLRGTLTAAPGTTRTGMTSSVDVAPLLLTLGTGSNGWRRDARYMHLAHRHDLAAMLADPHAPGRPYVLHATDEIVCEFATEPYAANAPLHVVAIRTPAAKYALYSYWKPRTSVMENAGEERELYDYSTTPGVLELDNVAGSSALEAGLHSQLLSAVRYELREPPPSSLLAAHNDGYADYFTTAQRTALIATAARRRIEETEAPGTAAEKLGQP